MRQTEERIKTYVLGEITIKLSGALRKASVSSYMRREVEQSSYWPIVRNVKRPKESIEQNVKLTE
jgi:hypothetical protein